MSVAYTGSRVSAIALPWFVLTTTGSATQTGLVAFAEMTPYVLVKALSGPLVDRVGPRLVSWTTDLVSALAICLVPLLHAADQLNLGLLLALVAVVGASRGPGDLAKEVMIPEAAERGAVPLERAAGFAGVIERLASTVGPLAGGGLIALVGPLSGLFVNAGCFVAGSLLIRLTLPKGMGQPAGAPESAGAEPGAGVTPGADQAPGGGAAGARTGYWQQMAEGFRFLRRTPLLLAVLLTVAFTNLLDAAYSAVLLPVWAERTDAGPSGIGLLAAVFSIGAVVGSLVATAIAHRLPRRPVLLIGYAVCGLPRFLIMAWALSHGGGLLPVAAVFAVAGLGAGFLNPIISAVTFELVPRPLLGRVKGLGTSLAWSGIPLGGLLGGLAVTAAGLVPTLLVAGVLYFVATTTAGLRPEWRAMDRDRRHGADVAPDRPPGQRPPAAAPPDAPPDAPAAEAGAGGDPAGDR
ncbi:MFS transporter [Streptomyces sp. DSM 44915]|uniref:Multidrug efflux pump Tap n=1 Tax=Streptomyces chisholmiae TaxID=3075540 RepID=A0ABU2JPE1_9ACTN|nr:MFS transporter [Streptomyces sp. DSM 44915]MDT0266862.1 MFS transporter [Streptomyces sp. DSM 44915]